MEWVRHGAEIVEGESALDVVRGDPARAPGADLAVDVEGGVGREQAAQQIGVVGRDQP